MLADGQNEAAKAESDAAAEASKLRADAKKAAAEITAGAQQDAATAQSEAAAAKRAADRALSTVAQINSQQAAAQAEFDGTWAINVFQWDTRDKLTQEIKGLQKDAKEASKTADAADA